MRAWGSGRESGEDECPQLREQGGILGPDEHSAHSNAFKLLFQMSTSKRGNKNEQITPCLQCELQTVLEPVLTFSYKATY